MRKIYNLLLMIILASMMSACMGDKFKIDGSIEGLHGTEIRVMFAGDSGIVNEFVPIDKKGHFSFSAQGASQPTLVSIMDRQGEVLTMLVVTNGDHVKVNGDAGKPLGIKVKGSKVNEDWQMFRDEHAAFYTDANPSRLDAAIEKYIGEHPKDLLSTVLLVADYSNYSDRGKVSKMLKSIDAAARPESLTLEIGTARQPGKESLPRIMTLTLVKHGGSAFEEIKLTGHVSLLYMWGQPQNQREAINRQLGALASNIAVIDILTESDTLKWHKTIAGESRQHYWAPAGPLEQGLQLLHVTTLPWFAVTDSTGLVTYSGPDYHAVEKALNTALEPKK